MDALVASDTQFHELLIDVSGRRRLKDLWAMLNSQMGALMRAEIERQGIGLAEAVERHRGILDAVTDGDLDRLRAEIRDHYLVGFPELGAQPRRRGRGLAAQSGRTARCGHPLRVVQVAGDRPVVADAAAAAAHGRGRLASPCGQRGWKWQPDGRSMAFGMSPVSAGLMVLRAVETRGAARTSAWV